MRDRDNLRARLLEILVGYEEGPQRAWVPGVVDFWQDDVDGDALVDRVTELFEESDGLRKALTQAIDRADPPGGQRFGTATISVTLLRTLLNHTAPEGGLT